MTEGRTSEKSLRPEVELRVVLGSTSSPGRLHRALAEAIERGAARGTAADLLDLGTVQIGFADGSDPNTLDDDTAATITSVESAPALIIATPVYRGSMTGALKNLFDVLPVTALQGKVVGLVAMGASDHHFLGAERHLRDVLAFFGAIVMPVGVYLSSGDFADGVPGGRAAQELDELIAATVAGADALADVMAIKGLAPLAARAIKARG
ncbi:MAG: NAD(P)H-dependent oxidoreductase [Solirubrobacterales bacterium]